MARKRLSDLLREEAKKDEPEKDSSETAIEAEVIETTKAPAAENPIATPASPAMEAAQEIAVADQKLQVALAEAEKREASLQQQVTDLTAQLDQQTSLITSLKADLEKARAATVELEKAKHTALQLAEENTQLQQEVKALKQPTSTKPALSRKASEPVAPPAPAPNPGEAAHQAAMRKQQERSLAHPMFPAGSSPGQLSNQDLGWVD